MNKLTKLNIEFKVRRALAINVATPNRQMTYKHNAQKSQLLVFHVDCTILYLRCYAITRDSYYQVAQILYVISIIASHNELKHSSTETRSNLLCRFK